MSSSRENGAGRDDLTGEHRFGDSGQAITAAIFAAVWSADTFVLRWTTVLNGVIPNAVRAPIGLALLGLAGALAIGSLRIVFGERRDPPVVIKKGLYAHMRHPMYLSEVVLYAGFLFLSMSLAALMVWIGAVVFLRFLCRHEERLLIGRFGDDYREYMRTVPMWLPRLRRKRNV